MNEQVNGVGVLAVLDDAATTLAKVAQIQMTERAEEMREARAAVAELIEENKLLRAKARNWDALLAARATMSADPEDCHWKERARQGLIMDAIRECRAMHGYSLTEARDCVQGYVARVGGAK